MFKARTEDEILHDLRQIVRANIDDVDPWIVFNNLNPTLKALALTIRGQELRLEWVHEQAFTTLAEGEYLDFHGIQAGGLSRDPATYAQGNLDVDAVLGTVVDDSLLIARSDGIQFLTVGTTTAIVSPFKILVRAVDPGELSNTDAGATLTAVIPIVGVNSMIVDDDGLIGGVEEEIDDSFRQRILYHKQNPPHGGSSSEYIEWAMTKIGVTRVFVQRATPGPGSVTIYFMMDGIGNGIPSAADVADLKDLIKTLAPEQVDLNVFAPTPQVVNITVSGLVPDTSILRDRIRDEIKDMFLRRAEPASVIESKTFAKAWITEAVSMAPRWRRSIVTVPAGDVVISTAGVIPILGTVTFA